MRRAENNQGQQLFSVLRQNLPSPCRDYEAVEAALNRNRGGLFHSPAQAGLRELVEHHGLLRVPPRQVEESSLECWGLLLSDREVA